MPLRKEDFLERGEISHGAVPLTICTAIAVKACSMVTVPPIQPDNGWIGGTRFSMKRERGYPSSRDQMGSKQPPLLIPAVTAGDSTPEPSMTLK